MTGPTRFYGSVLKACQIWKTGREMKRKSSKPDQDHSSVQGDLLNLVHQQVRGSPFCCGGAAGGRTSSPGFHTSSAGQEGSGHLSGLCSGSEPQRKALLVQTFPWEAAGSLDLQWSLEHGDRYRAHLDLELVSRRISLFLICFWTKLRPRRKSCSHFGEVFKSTSGSRTQGAGPRGVC